jgi:D-aspartate ligase
VATTKRARSKASESSTAPAIACVLGEIDLVTALGRAGIPCAVAAVPGDPATYSRHVKDRLEWFDPWDRPHDMSDALMRWARAQANMPVLFYNGDHDLLLVSRERDRLDDLFRFIVPDADLVENLVDKMRFAELARSNDLPVPAATTFDAEAASPEDVEIGYPLVVKPTRRRHSTWNPTSGGSKAIRVEDVRQLRSLWPRLAEHGTLMAQALIAGGEDRIESLHVYVRPGGEIACSFTGRKIRTMPAEFGDTTSLEITDEEDVRETGIDVVRKIGLTGVAKLDFKRDERGRLWLLEINPRFTLWHNAGAAAGANIPALVYADLTGQPRPQCETRTGTTWCHPIKDLRAARAQGISALDWLRFARRCDARWALTANDPLPFARGVLARRLGSKFRRRG